MRRNFHQELDSLTTAVVRLTELVARAITSATAGLLDADLRAAESVISGDLAIDQLYVDIEMHALDLMARQQPVGPDLRLIIATLRMVAEIERMGDLALHVAKVARRRYPAVAIPEPARPALAEMANIAADFAHRCARAVAERDVTAAARLDHDDDRIDDLHRRLFAVVLHPDWEHGTDGAIDVTLCGRYYERFCDHAVAVADEVAFVGTGRRGPAVVAAGCG